MTDESATIRKAEPGRQPDEQPSSQLSQAKTRRVDSRSRLLIGLVIGLLAGIQASFLARTLSVLDADWLVNLYSLNQSRLKTKHGPGITVLLINGNIHKPRFNEGLARMIADIENARPAVIGLGFDLDTPVGDELRDQLLGQPNIVVSMSENICKLMDEIKPYWSTVDFSQRLGAFVRQLHKSGESMPPLNEDEDLKSLISRVPDSWWPAAAYSMSRGEAKLEKEDNAYICKLPGPRATGYKDFSQAVVELYYLLQNRNSPAPIWNSLINYAVPAPEVVVLSKDSESSGGIKLKADQIKDRIVILALKGEDRCLMPPNKEIESAIIQAYAINTRLLNADIHISPPELSTIFTFLLALVLGPLWLLNSHRWRILSFVASVLGVVVFSSLSFGYSVFQSISAPLFSILFTFLGSTGLYFVLDLNQKRKELLASNLDLRNTQSKLRQAGQNLTNARNRERKSLRQKLHTSFENRLNAIIRSGKSDGDGNIKVQKRILTESLHELERILQGLSPLELETGQLYEALEKLVDGMNELMIEGDREMTFRIEDKSEGRINELRNEVQEQIYWMVRETFNNADKHSDANEVLVSIELVDNKFIISVIDDGKGMGEPDKDSSGLFEINNRAAEISAELDWSKGKESEKGPGTQLRITLNAPI